MDGGSSTGGPHCSITTCLPTTQSAHGMHQRALVTSINPTQQPINQPNSQTHLARSRKLSGSAAAAPPFAAASAAAAVAGIWGPMNPCCCCSGATSAAAPAPPAAFWSSSAARLSSSPEPSSRCRFISTSPSAARSACVHGDEWAGSLTQTGVQQMHQWPQHACFGRQSSLQTGMQQAWIVWSPGS